MDRRDLLIGALSIPLLVKSLNAKEVELKKYAVLDFTATWCGPCRQMKPIWESGEVKEKLKKKPAEFYEIDVDKNENYVKMYGVSSIPCAILVEVDEQNQGVEISRLVGARSKQQVLQWLD